jgi:hypothetical protein
MSVNEGLKNRRGRVAQAPTWLRRFVVVASAVLLAGCVRTTVTAFRDPAFIGRTFSSPAIFADFSDVQQRVLFEQRLSAELARRGVVAKLTTQLSPPTREYEPGERWQALLDAGVDSLIVVSPTEMGTTTSYIPMTGSTTTTRGSVQLNDNSAHYEEKSETTYDGGYYVSNPWAKMATRVFDVATKQVAWFAASSSTGGSTATWDDMRRSYCRNIVKSMVEGALFPPPSPSSPPSPSPTRRGR